MLKISYEGIFEKLKMKFSLEMGNVREVKLGILNDSKSIYR